MLVIYYTDNDVTGYAVSDYQYQAPSTAGTDSGVTYEVDSPSVAKSDDTNLETEESIESVADAEVVYTESNTRRTYSSARSGGSSSGTSSSESSSNSDSSSDNQGDNSNPSDNGDNDAEVPSDSEDGDEYPWSNPNSDSDSSIGDDERESSVEQIVEVFTNTNLDESQVTAPALNLG